MGFSDKVVVVTGANSGIGFWQCVAAAQGKFLDLILLLTIRMIPTQVFTTHLPHTVTVDSLTKTLTNVGGAKTVVLACRTEKSTIKQNSHHTHTIISIRCD